MYVKEEIKVRLNMIVDKYVNLMILHNSIIISKIKNQQVMRNRTNSYIKKLINKNILFNKRHQLIFLTYSNLLLS